MGGDGPSEVDELVELVGRLRAAGCVYAEEEAVLLREAATAADPTCVAAGLERLVAARVAGRPLEHLLGWAEFDGHRFAVAAGVFVPRRRSTLLVDLAELAAPPGGTLIAEVAPDQAAALADILAGAGLTAARTDDPRHDATAVSATATRDRRVS